MTQQQFEELRETFASFDGNNDGRIVYAEFARLLASLGAGLDDRACHNAFSRIDADHDGAIGFDEFAAWWVERPRLP
jgi:Ca2+-binding EF-hand superfamily protein